MQKGNEGECLEMRGLVGIVLTMLFLGASKSMGASDVIETGYRTNDVFVCGRVIDFRPAGFHISTAGILLDLIEFEITYPERWFKRQVLFSRHYEDRGPWRKEGARLSFWISTELLEEFWADECEFVYLDTVSLMKQQASCLTEAERLKQDSEVSVPSVINPVEYVQEVRETNFNQTGNAFWFLS